MKFTIGKKLGLAIAVLLTLFLTAMAFSYVQMRALERAFRQVTEIGEPTSAAAYEMEINLIGTGFAVLGYLHDRDSRHLARIRDGEERYQTQHRILAQIDTAKALGIRIDQDYARFRKLADELIQIEDRQTRARDSLLALLDEVDDLLDEAIQTSLGPGAPSAREKLQAALEMEINFSEIARGLWSFERTHDAGYEARIKGDARDLERYLAMYRDLAGSSEERLWARRIAQIFGRVVSLAGDVIALDKAQAEGLREFVQVRRAMGQVLDDEVQALTSSEMRRATHAVQRIVSRSGTMVLLLLLVGSGLGGTTALMVGRSVTNPVKRLVSACERIARGDFSEPVHVGTRDEFALLASSFNAMAAERERAEAALRRRDELQLVIDTNPSLIFVKDWDGRFTLANRAVAEAYGTTVPALLGKSDADFNSNRDEVEHSLRDDRTVMTTERAKLIPEEPATNRATGETRWFQTVKVPLPSVPGATRQVLVVATDITERKRLEGRLSSAALEWTQTFDAIDLPILLVGSDLCVRRSNVAATRLVSQDKATDPPGVPLGPRELWPVAARLARRVLVSREPLTTKVRLPAGQEWELSVSAVTLQTAENCVVLVGRDLTPMVELQEAARRSEVMSAIGLVAAGVAHEVRNPLQAIEAIVAACEARVETNEALRPFTTHLRQQVERVSTLMSDLLEYGRPAVLPVAPVRLADVVQESVQRCEARARAAGVEVRTELAEGVPALLLDQERMVRALENLLLNAIQHTPPGGQVTVRAAPGRGDGAPRVECTVTDSGPGFAPDELPAVFRPFHSRRKGGTGLGLSIVQRIMHEHGGTVSAANAPSGGALLSLTLPVPT